MGAIGSFSAHPRPDDASEKAGLDSSNTGMAPRLWRWERVAGGGSRCISGAWSPGSTFQCSVVRGCALLLQFTCNAPFDPLFLPLAPLP